jgi:hypothetical protein
VPTVCVGVEQAPSVRHANDAKTILFTIRSSRSPDALETHKSAICSTIWGAAEAACAFCE